MPGVKREGGGRRRRGKESALLKDFTFMNYAAIHERQNGLGRGRGHNDFPADLVECKNVFEHQLSKAALALALAPGWAVPEITLIKLSVLSVFLLLATPSASPSWQAHVP